MKLFNVIQRYNKIQNNLCEVSTCLSETKDTIEELKENLKEYRGDMKEAWFWAEHKDVENWLHAGETREEALEYVSGFDPELDDPMPGVIAKGVCDLKKNLPGWIGQHVVDILGEYFSDNFFRNDPWYSIDTKEGSIEELQKLIEDWAMKNINWDWYKIDYSTVEEVK